MPLVLLRAFYEAGDSRSASDFADRVCRLLTDAGYSINRAKVRTYWKIPEYMEVDIEFHTVGGQPTIDGAMHALGAGWSKQRDGEAVWNPTEGATFVDDLVRWAHLEVVG